MARLNIEDTIDADPRFRRLVRLLNGNDNEALGLLIRFWRLAQKYWGEGEHLVPEEEFRLDGFEPILKSGLAEKRSGGIYARGSEERFAWYRQRKVASTLGGEANKRNFGEKTPKKPEGKVERRVKSVKVGEPNSQLRLSETSPPDSPLTLTLNTKERRIVSKTCNTDSTNFNSKNVLLTVASPSAPTTSVKKVKVEGRHVQEFVARYIQAFERRYGTRPIVDGLAAGEAVRIVRGIGYPRCLDAAEAYLQIENPKYLAKCHDLTTFRMDLSKLTVALAQGVEEPNKDFAYEKWKTEFMKDEPEKIEGGSNGQD